MFQTTFSIHMRVQPSSQTQAKIFFLSLAISLAATPLSAEQNALHEAARFCDMPRAAHKKSKLQPIQKEQLNYYSFISCKAGHTPHHESCSHSFNLFLGFLGLLGQGGHPCFSTLQIPFCVIRQLLAQLEEIHHVFWFGTC